MANGQFEIEQIVASVSASPKYRNVCASTVRRIAIQAWERQRSLKAAIKAAKSRLHQVYSAYEWPVDYARADQELEAALVSRSPEAIRKTCLDLLGLHASTQERLPILDRFYAEILAHTGMPNVLFDLACGLNPLSLPWMGLPSRTAYRAYDIDGARVEFLNRFFALAQVDGRAHLQDILCDPPTERADIALLLKASACLEQQEKGGTLRLLDALNVRHGVVSFPVKSLGRREKGMLQHYERTFRQMITGRPWTVTRLLFPTELVFIVDKNAENRPGD